VYFFVIKLGQSWDKMIKKLIMIFDFIINFVSYGESGVFPWKTRYV